MNNVGVKADADEVFRDIAENRLPIWLDELQTYDVQEVRHGRWEELYENNYKCSVCGSWWTCEETPIESGMSYCPNCGSRMDLGGDAE